MMPDKQTQLYNFRCDECGEIETAEWDIAGDRHEAIDCVKGTLVYVGPVASEPTKDIGAIGIDKKCDHGVAKFLRCKQRALEGVYAYAQPEEHESAQTDPDLGIIADEVSNVREAVAESNEDFDAVSQNTDGKITPVAPAEPETALTLASEPENALESLLDTEKRTIAECSHGVTAISGEQCQECLADIEPDAIEADTDLFTSTPAPNDFAEPPTAEEMFGSNESEPTLNDILPDFDSLAAGENVAKETVVLELHVRRPSFRRAFDSRAILGDQKAKGDDCIDCDGQGFTFNETSGDTITCETCKGTLKVVGNKVDDDYIHVSKDIIDRSEIKNINKRIGVLKTYMRTRCVPSSILAAGLYLLPIKFIQEMDVAISSSQTDIEALLNEFEPRYPAMIENAKAKLGPHFNTNDYPQFSVLRAQWRIDAQYRSLNVPAVLATVNKQLFEREREKVKIQWADTAQEVRDALRVGFTRLVSEFSEKLGTDPESGKPRVFQKGRLEKLKDFLTTFECRDLTGDTELALLASQARQLIDGVDPNKLRKDGEFRTQLETGFAAIAEQAGKMVVVRERVLADDEY